MSPLKLFWRALQLIPEASTSQFAWKQLVGEEWPIAKQVLRSTGTVVRSVPCPHPDGGCSRRVVHHCDGRIVGICSNEEQCCDSVSLVIDEIGVLELDREKLGEDLCHLLGIDTEFRTFSGFGEAWQCGWYKPLAGSRFPVLAALPIDDDSAHSMAVRLQTHFSLPLMLFVPTRLIVDVPTSDYFRSQGSSLLFFEETLGFGHDGAWCLLNSREAILGDFRRGAVSDHISERPLQKVATPPGTTWGQVAIRFVNGHEVSVAVRSKQAGVRSCEHWNMSKRNREPTVQWTMLCHLAAGKGRYTWLSDPSREAQQKQRERLGELLQDIFGIHEDPFESSPDNDGFVARFIISPEI